MARKGGAPENLKPFKKGQSGNPNGRPKKLPKLDDLLDDVLGEEKDGISAAKAILIGLRAKAAKGDVRAAEVLLERAYGKAKQPIEQTGEVTHFNVNLTKEDMKNINQTLENEC